VFIVLNRRNYTPNHWIYIPGKRIFGRVHEPKNWSSYMAPENKTGACVEIFCNKDDDIWKMGNTEIAHQVIRTLPLLKEFEAEGHTVVRVEYAYPIYDINYRMNLEKLTVYLSSYKNLFLLGRVGTFKYINMDTCIKEGLKLGEFLIGKIAQDYTKYKDHMPDFVLS
jgi:protoporphyrinogen oxidase